MQAYFATKGKIESKAILAHHQYNAFNTIIESALQCSQVYAGDVINKLNIFNK